MNSKKHLAKARSRQYDYQQLAVLIFGDEEALQNYSENTPVNEERRKLIDRFVPTDWLKKLQRARARTAKARKTVDQMLRGELRPSHSSVVLPSDSIWAISGEELQELAAMEIEPRYVLDAYARAVFNEGRIDGQLWALIIQAHDRWRPKIGKKRGRYSKVAVAEAQMTILLKDYFKRRPGHIGLTDNAIRKNIEGEWDATFSDGAGGSASKVRRLVAVIRERYPEMRRPKAASRR